MKFKSLKPGDTFVLQYKGDLENGTYTPKFRRWNVIKIYSHHVLCSCGQIRECFTYGEMIQQGYEKGYNPVLEKDYIRRSWSKDLDDWRY